MITLVSRGRIVTGNQDYVGDILIDDGVIRSIGDLKDTVADTVVDAEGKLVIPGGVDPHTHLETPAMPIGTVVSDDFATGTVAGAVGGTTTIIDFPVQRHGDDPRIAFEEWLQKAEGRAAIDWAFHEIIIDARDQFLVSLDRLIDEGITSFKLFMAYPNQWMLDDGAIFGVMERTSHNGGFIMMHCENGLVIDRLVQEALARGNLSPEYHALTRPSTAEGEATSRAIALAEIAGVPLYIVHLSASEALDAVQRARARNLRVYAETCPHYLLLTSDKLAEPKFEGAKYVCSPPLRSSSHLEALWSGLASADLQVVSTDHAPFRFEDQKTIGRDDFTKIPNGLPGIEWRMSLLYHHGVRSGRLSLNRFVELTSTNAAKLFGLYPRKGELAPGSDGDIVVFDPTRRWVLSAETQKTNSDYNPYEGWILEGSPDVVLLRGQVVVRDGDYVGTPGQGRYLKCGESIALSSSERLR